MRSEQAYLRDKRCKKMDRGVLKVSICHFQESVLYTVAIMFKEASFEKCL